jgi:hypothetical protein
MSPRLGRGARSGVAAAVLASVALACSGGSPADGGGPLDASVDAPAPIGSIDGSTDASGDGPSAPVDSSSNDAAIAGCGEFAGDGTFTCSKDGNSRGKCPGDASLVVEACPNGCLREPVGQDSICMGTTDAWSCPGSYGTTRALDGNYYVTEFGCWVDDAGVHTDPADNCIPSCLKQAQAAGLCDPNGAGPDCEEKLGWYTADGARFGCLQRLRVTNPANGKSLIAIALDYGPGCSGEATVQHAVLDSSGNVDDYLFGGAKGTSEKALVHVVEVDDSYPLGPTN